MSRCFAVLTVLAVALWAGNAALAQTVVGSPHDLSNDGPNAAYQHAGTTEICVFCHTPHDANTNPGAPIWNKNYNAGYTAYGTTIAGTTTDVGAPNPSTMACMSCHDGTVALNVLRNTPGSGSPALAPSPTPAVIGTPNLGQDLRNDHPVSIQYFMGRAGLRDPAVNNTLPAGWLGAPNRRINETLRGAAFDRVECGSCHDPHNNTNTLFLRIANTNSQMCLGCHAK